MQKKISGGIKIIPKKYLLILISPLAYFINKLSLHNGLATEKFYSTGIYRGISWIFGNIAGLIPFSIAEFLLIILIIFCVWRFCLFAHRFIKLRGKRWLLIRNSILSILILTSIIYSSFIFMWGLNYNRLSYADISGLEVESSSTDDLIGLSEYLVYKVNELRENVLENDIGVMVPYGGLKGGINRAKLGFTQASKLVPELKNVYSKPKPILFSNLIAYTNIWGIYSPFTVESNFNTRIPTPMVLSTMMHEMAHQAGFAREDEANYIAYLTCSLHPDADFNYAGAIFALNYVLGALYPLDKDAYTDLYSKLDDGVKRDFAENTKYSKKYSGPVKEITSKSNDMYLKANNQDDGERSYGRMVDLLLAEFKYKKEQGDIQIER